MLKIHWIIKKNMINFEIYKTNVYVFYRQVDRNGINPKVKFE